MSGASDDPFVPAHQAAIAVGRSRTSIFTAALHGEIRTVRALGVVRYSLNDSLRHFGKAAQHARMAESATA